MTYILWLPLLGLGMCKKTKLHIKAGFYQHWAWGQVNKSPKAPGSPPPATSTSWLPVRLSLKESLAIL